MTLNLVGLVSWRLDLCGPRKAFPSQALLHWRLCLPCTLNGSSSGHRLVAPDTGQWEHNRSLSYTKLSNTGMFYYTPFKNHICQQLCPSYYKSVKGCHTPSVGHIWVSYIPTLAGSSSFILLVTKTSATFLEIAGWPSVQMPAIPLGKSSMAWKMMAEIAQNKPSHPSVSETVVQFLFQYSHQKDTQGEDWT